MERRERPYLFYSATRALCSVCLATVDAKELIEDGRVWLWKRCPEHGQERVLISDDVTYFKLCREVFLKPPEQVERYNTPFLHGCPHDCGICPDHEQHGCVSLLEITDHCNLRCPTCYANSGPERESERSMEEIRAMLDRIVANDVEPDVVQVSGGEPTTHPRLFEILDECRRRPIKHLMLNTNGIRIAQEDGFAEKLAAYQPGFEVYLQLDGLTDEVARPLRGADVTALKMRAVERLNEVGLSTTLVMTIRRGLNDDQIGEVVEWAAQQPAVRGVTLQPVYDSGRNERFEAEEHRITLSEVRRRLSEQFPAITLDDVVPVPCHPDCLAMAYAIRGAGERFSELTPLTRHVPADILISGGKNSIVYEGMARQIFRTFSTAHGPESAGHALRDLLCCLPKVETLPDLTYDRVFRVIIMSFLDKHTLDLRSVRKSCVHVADRDGKRMIPMDTYNIFYRDAPVESDLVPLESPAARRSKAKRAAKSAMNASDDH